MCTKKNATNSNRTRRRGWCRMRKRRRRWWWNSLQFRRFNKRYNFLFLRHLFHSNQQPSIPIVMCPSHTRLLIFSSSSRNPCLYIEAPAPEMQKGKFSTNLQHCAFVKFTIKYSISWHSLSMLLLLLLHVLPPPPLNWLPFSNIRLFLLLLL